MPSPHQTQSLPRGCEVLQEKTDRKKIRKFWLWIDPFNENDLENLFLSFFGEWEVVSRAGCPGPQCPDFLSASCKSRALLLVEVMCPLTHVHTGCFFNWHPPENVSWLAPSKFAWTGTPLNCVGITFMFMLLGGASLNIQTFSSVGGASLGLLDF